jgi:hypothetical protein
MVVSCPANGQAMNERRRDNTLKYVIVPAAIAVIIAALVLGLASYLRADSYGSILPF